MNEIIVFIRNLTRRLWSYCLKSRHWALILTVHLGVLSSCGRINEARSRNADLLMMEYGCYGGNNSESPLTRSIKSLYFKAEEHNPFRFMNIRPRLYDFQNPLRLSPSLLQQSYNELKDGPMTDQMAEDLFYLLAGAQRFDSQKCALRNLTARKAYDLRPYLQLIHFCLKNYNNESCQDEKLNELAPAEETFVKKNVLEICSFWNNSAKCALEYKKNKAEENVARMVQGYTERFQRERFNSLFKLHGGHLKFPCKKTDDFKTIMMVKIYLPMMNAELADELISALEQVWSTTDFAIKLIRINQRSADSITVLPTPQGNSYVPDNNNRLVYLSTTLEPAAMKRVLAHEFGHVLGFPDCYIEFFDNVKKELVYYEIGEKNTNIMCSLKNNVFVQPESFQQLRENSCLFN